MMRLCKSAAAAMVVSLAFAATAEAKECKAEPVVQESSPYVSRTLGAFPNSLLMWRKAVMDAHGDGWQAWRRAEDRKIDCEQVTVAAGRRWVCTRSARPCSGAGSEKLVFPGRMQRGSQNEGVRQLQELLRESGYKIEVDGNFGRGTRDAVRDFQSKEGIVVDGVVGQVTWDRLTG